MKFAPPKLINLLFSSPKQQPLLQDHERLIIFQNRRRARSVRAKTVPLDLTRIVAYANSVALPAGTRIRLRGPGSGLMALLKPRRSDHNNHPIALCAPADPFSDPSLLDRVLDADKHVLNTEPVLKREMAFMAALEAVVRHGTRPGPVRQAAKPNNLSASSTTTGLSFSKARLSAPAARNRNEGVAIPKPPTSQPNLLPLSFCSLGIQGEKGLHFYAPLTVGLSDESTVRSRRSSCGAASPDREKVRLSGWEPQTVALYGVNGNQQAYNAMDSWQLIWRSDAKSQAIPRMPVFKLRQMVRAIEMAFFMPLTSNGHLHARRDSDS